MSGDELTFSVVIKNGRLQIGSKEGSFEEGSEQIKKLNALLDKYGLKVEWGGIEQHDHSPDHIHVHMVDPLRRV